MADQIDVDVARVLGRIEGTQEQILEELRNTRLALATHIAEDKAAFASINADSNRAKGAGYVILTLLAGLASFVGAAVVAVVGGWLKF